MESSNQKSSSHQNDQSSYSEEEFNQNVTELLEFGFDFDEAVLALKITTNDKSAAANLLCSGGVTLESL